MKRKILLLFIASCFSSAYAQRSPKRGLAYGHHTVADIQAIAPDTSGISWWYNWSSLPDAGITNFYQSIGVQFVPMVWGGTFNENTVIANIRPDAKFLLAFNEPNFTDQANLTPAQAVNLWPKIEAIAAAKNLEIVSAAAAYGGSMAGYNSAVAWQDTFFKLCPACKVDYIAFHAYDPAASSLIGVVGTMKKYGRPIWVTEFALWDPSKSAAAKLPYLQQAVQSFENDPDIYRYSWFTGRASSNPSIDLLGANGVLTALGTAYKDAAYGPQNTIPGKTEAETHYRRRGIDKENTTDTGGGQNIGWFDPGDWAEYLVNINADGYYNFEFRVAAAANAGKFHLLLDDSVITNTISFNPTGGYQVWTSIYVNNVALKQGQHLLKLVSEAAGFNINYFKTTYTNPLETSEAKPQDPVQVFPNPFTGKLTVEVRNPSLVNEVQVVDVSGKLIRSFGRDETIDLGDVSKGIYFIRIIESLGVYHKMVVKE